MDRLCTSESEYRPAMRVGRSGAIQLLLCATVRKRAELVVAAVAGPILHALAVLRQSPPARAVAAPRGLWCEPQTGATVDGHAGPGSHLSPAAPEPTRCRSRDLPLPAAGCRHQYGQPGLEQRYYLYPAARRLRLFGRGHRLVQPFRAQLGRVQHHRCLALPRGAGRRFGGPPPAGDLQHRSGLHLYQRIVLASAERPQNPHQHGWPRSRSGQRVHRTPLAHRQVRARISARVRLAGRSPSWPEQLLLRVQLPAATSGSAVSYPGRGLLRSRQATRNMTFLDWGSAPNPGIYRFWARMSGQLRRWLPPQRIPAPESALRSAPCVAVSHAQVLIIYSDAGWNRWLRQATACCPLLNSLKAVQPMGSTSQLH